MGLGSPDLKTSLRLSQRERQGTPFSVVGSAYFFKRRFEEAAAKLLTAIQQKSGIDDRTHPTEPRIARRRMSELQEMNEDPTHLAAHGIAFALAQILDLVGEVLAVEAVVAGAQGAQDLGRVSSPGVKIVVVAWSVWHRSRNIL
jgi:hypothetical protein